MSKGKGYGKSVSVGSKPGAGGSPTKGKNTPTVKTPKHKKAKTTTGPGTGDKTGIPKKWEKSIPTTRTPYGK